MAVAWLQRQDRRQFLLQAAPVFEAGAFLQGKPSTGEQDGAQQKRLEARREHAIARLDRVAQIAQLVRQTDLPFLGVAAARAIQYGSEPLQQVHFDARSDAFRLAALDAD